MPVTHPDEAFEFGHFAVQPDRRRLLVQGRAAPIGARAFDLLLVLIEHRHRLVSKQELMALVWPQLVVEENNLQVQVSTLRKLLGPQAITTVPGRGYRFTAVPESPATPAAPQPSDAPAPPPTRSPAAAAEAALYGRDSDRQALQQLLQQHRLVSIVGAGGMGKTRLAQAVLAERGAAGASAWVELAPVTDPAHVPGSIGAALGLPVRGPDALAGLAEALRPLELLLVLDNAEHLAPSLQALVARLLADCPGLQLLLTSQVPLHAEGEAVHRLEGLALPSGPAWTVGVEHALTHAAVALFCDRASHADRRFRLDAANLSAVIEICRRLDGLPLAIELAAARVALLGARGLLQHLDERLQLLANNRALQPRQRSLRAALEWSHGLLGPAEQACFRRLAVFSGGFTLALAQAVVPAPGDAGLDRWQMLDALAELLDRSLLVVGAQDPPRYQWLESPRALALEQLAAAGEDTAVRGRHADAVAAWFAERDEDLLQGRVGMDAWLQQLAPEIDNGREALAWSLQHAPAQAVRLAPGLLRALTTARLPERKAIVAATEPLLHPGLPAALRAAWHQAAGLLVPGAPAWRVGQLREAVALHRALQEPAALHLSISALLGLAEDLPGAEIEALHAELRQIGARTELPPRSRMLACQAEYFYCYVHQDWPGAEAALQHQVDWARRAGHSDAADTALSNLADLAFTTGDIALAVRRGRELLQHRSGGRRLHNLELARVNLAACLALQGRAADVGAEVRSLARQGLPRAPAFLMTGLWADVLALLAALEQRPRTAALLCGFADAAYLALADQRGDATLAARARTEPLARAALGDAGFEQLRRRGDALDLEAAAALGLAEQDSG